MCCSVADKSEAKRKCARGRVQFEIHKSVAYFCVPGKIKPAHSHSCCPSNKVRDWLKLLIYSILCLSTHICDSLSHVCLPFYDSAGTCGRRIKTQNSIKMHIAAMRGIFPYFLIFFYFFIKLCAQLKHASNAPGQLPCDAHKSARSMNK